MIILWAECVLLRGVKFSVPVANLAGGVAITPALILPFALLLFFIAVMPLTPPGVKHLWAKYYAVVAMGLGAIVAGFFS